VRLPSWFAKASEPRLTGFWRLHDQEDPFEQLFGETHSRNALLLPIMAGCSSCGRAGDERPHKFVKSASGRCRQASTTLPSIAAVTRSMSTGSRTTIGRRPSLSRAPRPPLARQGPGSDARGIRTMHGCQN
jgi:hypothetical protein